MSRPIARAVPPPALWKPQGIARETFGMLRDRAFRLWVKCDPCKAFTSISLVERNDLADVAVGSIDFQCHECGGIGHYRLEPPDRSEKRLLHEQASACRGPADEDCVPFVGPFPRLTTGGELLVGDFVALGFSLLARCGGGRERLIDPRDAKWHHLHRRSLRSLKLRCEGCRRPASVLVVPSWYRRKGFRVIRASKPPAPAAPPATPVAQGGAYSALQSVDEVWRRVKSEHEAAQHEAAQAVRP